MRKLVLSKNSKIGREQYYTFATDQDLIKWAVLPYAKINTDGNPQVEFTPAYYQAKQTKQECKSFEILDQASKIMKEGKITFSIWLPKQCWTLYGTPKKEVTLKIGAHHNNELSDLEYDFD